VISTPCVAKWDVTGAFLHYATYLGRRLDDTGEDIVVDSLGNAYVVGWTDSVNFPVTPAALQSTFRGETDAFVVKLNPRGSHLGYSTYLGAHTRRGPGMARDAAGDIYLAGRTESANFRPPRLPTRPNFAGTWDAVRRQACGCPTITTVSAASFLAGRAGGANAIVGGYGPEMSPVTQVAPTGSRCRTAPRGVTVNVKEARRWSARRSCSFVSAGQINYLVPVGTAAGWLPSR